MTAFVLLAAAMLLAAVALLTRPFWWRSSHSDAAGEARTIADAREQMRQLDALRSSGALTDAQASEARARLEQRVGQALAQVPSPAPATPRAPPGMLGALTAFTIVVAIAGYTLIGTPQALDPEVRTARAEGSGGGHSITMEQIEGMAEKLAARLKEQPNDVDGWAMLGRSYAVLGKPQQALPAFKQAMALRPDDPVLLADYADTLALVNGRNLEGEPSRLIARALELDPNNLKALSLAGTAAFVRKDYALALRHWEKMAQISPDSDFVKQIQGGIEEARTLAAAAGQRYRRRHRRPKPRPRVPPRSRPLPKPPAPKRSAAWSNCPPG